MREILFRGKTYNDKWVQGLLVQMDDHLTQIRKLGSDGIGYYDYSIVPSTVGWFNCSIFVILFYCRITSKKKKTKRMGWYKGIFQLCR